MTRRRGEKKRKKNDKTTLKNPTHARVRHGVAVRGDVAIEAPVAARHLVEQPRVGAGRDAVDGVVTGRRKKRRRKRGKEGTEGARRKYHTEQKRPRVAEATKSDRRGRDSA